MLQGESFQRLRKFRVGDYRVIFELKNDPIEHQKHPYLGIIIIIAIGLRKDIYRP